MYILESKIVWNKIYRAPFYCLHSLQVMELGKRGESEATADRVQLV